jgi:protein O-mannosyl-transferase
VKFKYPGNILANPWFALILIAVTVLVIYSNVYDGPFVFDGKTQIEHNEKIRDLDNYLSLKGFFPHRPLVAFSYAINYRLCKLDTFGYHLVNNLIHLVNGFLAYFLALQIFYRLSFFQSKRLKNASGSKVFHGLKTGAEESERNISQTTIPIMALLVALIFSAHPIQTQAVTYIGQRYTSMSAMFYMTSLFLYIWARKYQVEEKKTTQEGSSTEDLSPQKTDKSPARFGPKVLICFFLSLCSGAFALFCKENAATLFGVILLVEYFLFDRTWRGWKMKLTWLVPLSFVLAFLVLYYFASTRGLKFGNLLEDVSILTRETRSIGRWSYLCTQFSVIVIYIRLLFIPVGQNLDHMYPFKEGFFDGATPLAFLFVLTVFLVGIWNIRKRSAVSFGIFWFFITLSIESSIFTISDAMFEHRLYLPMFGFAISVVYMVFDLLGSRKGWATFFLMLGIVALGTTAYSRNQVWQDSRVLWEDVVSKSPLNHRGHNNLGTVLNDQGHTTDAILEFTEALRIKPDFAFARNNLGNALFRQGKYNEAILHLREALRLKPNLLGTHNNMGIILSIKGDFDNAIRHFKKALAINPRSAETHSNLGNFFLAQRKYDQAAQHFQKALKFNPGLSQARQGLKQTLERN